MKTYDGGRSHVCHNRRPGAFCSDYQNMVQKKMKVYDAQVGSGEIAPNSGRVG